MRICSGISQLEQTTENSEIQARFTGSSQSGGMLADRNSWSHIPFISRSELQTLICLLDVSTSFSNLPHTATKVVFWNKLDHITSVLENSSVDPCQTPNKIYSLYIIHKALHVVSLPFPHTGLLIPRHAQLTFLPKDPCTFIASIWDIPPSSPATYPWDVRETIPFGWPCLKPIYDWSALLLYLSPH